MAGSERYVKTIISLIERLFWQQPAVDGYKNEVRIFQLLYPSDNERFC